MAPKDLTGQLFGKLTAVSLVGRTKHGKAVWECRCACGKIMRVVGGALQSGNTKSCGDGACCSRTKHGHTARGRVSPTYTSWQAMLDRCYNPNNSEYARYGASGIGVCDQWHQFSNFLAAMGERLAGTSIDRFPNKSGNYEPGNCRWATPQEQTVNRSITKLTLESVREIHDRHAQGESNASIAAPLRISPCHVSLILSGAKWKGSRGMTPAAKSKGS